MDNTRVGEEHRRSKIIQYTNQSKQRGLAGPKIYLKPVERTLCSGTVPIKKDCLPLRLCSRGLPPSPCLPPTSRANASLIWDREIECLLNDNHQKGKMIIMIMKTSGSQVDSPVVEGKRTEGGGRKMRDLHRDT